MHTRTRRIQIIYRCKSCTYELGITNHEFLQGWQWMLSCEIDRLSGDSCMNFKLDIALSLNWYILHVFSQKLWYYHMEIWFDIRNLIIIK